MVVSHQNGERRSHEQVRFRLSVSSRFRAINQPASTPHRRRLSKMARITTFAGRNGRFRRRTGMLTVSENLAYPPIDNDIVVVFE